MSRSKLYLTILMFIILNLFIVPRLSANECKVSIIHFNDFHGYFKAPDKKLGGAERLANLIAKIDTANTAAGIRTILLVGGDLVFGTPVSEAYKGELETLFLNKINAEAMVIGNHEFEFGIEQLKKNMKKAEFPVLAANIMDHKTRQLFTDTTVVFPLEEGCRVGVLGLTTKSTSYSSGEDLSPLEFNDEVEVAGYYIDDLMNQSDLRIALTHMPLKDDINLAEKVDGFDLIVGGHDHVRPEEYCRTVNKVEICETPPKGTYLGKIDVVIKDGKSTVVGKTLIPVDKKAGTSKEIKEFLKPYLAETDTGMKEVVGSVDRDYNYRSPAGKVEQTEAGKFFAEIFRKYANADAGVMNSGSVRKALKKGKLTLGDIFEVMPFRDDLVTMNLSGRDIIWLIEKSEQLATPERIQPYLCWAGLEYQKNGGVITASIGGKPMKPDAVYKIAISNYLGGGHDGYTLLKDKKTNTTGKMMREIVIESFKNPKN